MLTLAIPTKQLPDTSRLTYGVVDEPFVDISEFSDGKILVDMKYYLAGRPGAVNKAYVRLDVAKRLYRVAENLPNGLRLKIYDAWRPYEVQKSLFDEYLASISLLPENRAKSEGELFEIAKKYVSIPDRTKEFSYVHSSGGAVDLTLTDAYGIELDMGCGFDDFSPKASVDFFESDENSPACKNRRILYNAMTEAGFTSYSAEWWHYDFGDIFWGAITEKAVKYRSVYLQNEVVSGEKEEKIAEKYDIFISYRRGGGEVMARLVYELLKSRNYNVFFDHQTLTSGEYDKKLLHIIKNCKDFIVIFSEDCFKVEGESGAYYMKEIKCAIESGVNILPLMIDGYQEPSEDIIKGYADPNTVRKIKGFHGKKIQVDGIDGIIDEICTGEKLLKSTPRLTTSEVFAKCDEFIDLIREKTYLDMLSEEMKLSVVRSAIEALGDEYSAPILKSTLSRLSGGLFNVRKKFRYNIRIESDFKFKGIDIPSDKYFKLAENLSYTKVFRQDRLRSGEPFWISFVTGLSELDEELRDEKFFFSENLMIDKADMLRISTLDDNAKSSFYNSVMRVQIAINDIRLEPMEIVINDGGIFARYDMPDDIDETVSVTIRFQIPQKYENSFFFACINEPTYSPNICVEFDEDDFKVEMIPFLTRSLTTKDTRILDGVCELSVENEWIMPVSGAIFLIDKI